MSTVPVPVPRSANNPSNFLKFISNFVNSVGIGTGKPSWGAGRGLNPSAALVLLSAMVWPDLNYRLLLLFSVLRIRIRKGSGKDPDSIGSVDPDPVFIIILFYPLYRVSVCTGNSNANAQRKIFSWHYVLVGTYCIYRNKVIFTVSHIRKKSDTGSCVSEMEVRDNLAKVSRLCQLLSHNRGFLYLGYRFFNP